MAKIEKTLELNITHELLSLADSFWWFLQPISLKRYWRPHWRFPFMQLPKSFATGLHINLEGKKGGGYDVCINSPSNFQGGNPRLVFMQFKAGVEKPYNTNSASKFFGNPSSLNIHVEFDINSNTNKNQHELLQKLALKAGQEDAVVYVFPRIVNNNQLEQNIGNLIRKTSFISIAEMDKKANDNGVKIDDGSAHKFRTCYNDYDKNEVNFFFFFFGKQEKPGGLLGEIFAIRMYRALMTLKEVQNFDYPISKYHVIDAIIRHVMNIGLYFSISYTVVLEKFGNNHDFQRRLQHFDKYENQPKGYELKTEPSQYDLRMFNDIFGSISQYIRWIEDINSFDSEIKIPKPPSEYTIELPNNGLKYEINTENKQLKEEDLDEIFYQLF